MRNFLQLSVMALALASNAYATDSAVMVGRYSTIDPKPLNYQEDLFDVIVRVGFPNGIDTVGQALEHLSARSGFRVTSDQASCPSLPILLSLPLPAVHRELGPMSLLDALKTLAGPTHYLVIDPVHRLISFQVRHNYKLLLAGRGLESSALPRTEASNNPRVAEEHRRDHTPMPSDSAGINVQSTPPALGSIERYGPVKPKEQLWPIAEAMSANSQISTERVVIALLYMNPNAFCCNNINCLKVGAYLEPPPMDVLAEISDADARAEVRRQYRAWVERTKDNAQADQHPEEKRL
jgi:type IV pili sensor histidine kinase/response regulator